MLSRGTRIEEKSVQPAPSWPRRQNANSYLIAAFAIVLVVLIILWDTAPQWEGPLGLGPKGSSGGQSYVSVNVSRWTFNGPAVCWQGSVFSYGGIVLVGGVLPVSVNLPYPGGLVGPNCTADSVHVLTAGFSLVDSSAPVRVVPGAAERLYVNVTAPSSTYTGPLNMSVDVVSP